MGGRPHVVYTLCRLDVARMREEWETIRRDPSPHYNLLRKNCATMVLRVLKAGGALEGLPLTKSAWFSNNIYVSPKNVAQICNELRNIGYAAKMKDADCPAKGRFFFGLR